MFAKALPPPTPFPCQPLHDHNEHHAEIPGQRAASARDGDRTRSLSAHRKVSGTRAAAAAPCSSPAKPAAAAALPAAHSTCRQDYVTPNTFPSGPGHRHGFASLPRQPQLRRAACRPAGLAAVAAVPAAAAAASLSAVDSQLPNLLPASVDLTAGRTEDAANGPVAGVSIAAAAAGAAAAATAVVAAAAAAAAPAAPALDSPLSSNGLPVRADDTTDGPVASVRIAAADATAAVAVPEVDAAAAAAAAVADAGAEEVAGDGNHVRDAWEALKRWSRSWRRRKEDNVLARTTKIAVLGGGSFGTAMAVLLARNKRDMDVVILLRNADVCRSINEDHTNRKAFPRHTLPANVRATTDAREALEGAQFCIHAVPVQSSTAFLQSIAPHVPPTLPILSVSKGLEVSTLEMMSQLIPRALGNPRQPVAVISGPSFSIELMDELPTGLVAASKDMELARAAQQLLASRYLRVNTSTDVVGVEMAGALKNVLAIAAGIVEGMQLGNNCMAALVAQGCAEIRWLAEKMGAKPATLAGLSGTGDIMLTCFVNLSRNRTVGVRLGSGERLEDILASTDQVAEGVATAGAVIALARKYRVQMPVLTAVAQILEGELTPKKAVLELMSLPQVEEK